MRIDVDFHLPQPPMRALLPHLDEYWRMQVVEREIDTLPFRLTSYPPNAPLAQNPAFAGMTVPEALDAFGTQIAVGSLLHGALALHNPDMRAALLSAVNDHLAAELDKEPRLRGSILVSAEDPEAAVAEIDRLAGDRRFVQVTLLAMGDVLVGHRRTWPILAAAERHGLALAIHAGGVYRSPPSVSGWPSFQFEDYVIQSQVFENLLVSLVAEGVFSKFPELRVVFLESGFAWLPTTLWRMDKTWRGTRQEVPWIDRRPSELIAGRVFVSLTPVDVPAGEALTQLLRHIGGPGMLLYSTDFPHRQFEGADPLPPGLPEDALPGILAGNALKAYPRLAAEPALADAAAPLEADA